MPVKTLRAWVLGRILGSRIDPGSLFWFVFLIVLSAYFLPKWPVVWCMIVHYAELYTSGLWSGVDHFRF